MPSDNAHDDEQQHYTADRDTETEPHALTRREVGAATATGLASATAPLSVAWFGDDDALTPLASASVSGVLSQTVESPHADVSIKRYYDGLPSWTVSLSDADDMDALTDRIDGSSGEFLRQGEDIATVALSADAMLGEFGGSSGLASASYVDWVDINVSTEWIGPVALPMSTDDHVRPSRLVQALGGFDPAPLTGLAFDAETAPLADTRTTINADTVAATGSGVTVAVIDTGVTHDTDLFGTVGGRFHEQSANLVLEDDPTVAEEDVEIVADGNDHGTHVASTILANPADETYQGVAPGATLLAMKALTDDGQGATADIAAAIRAASDADADVICLSLGSPLYSEDIAEAIATADNAGALCVVASGNDRFATRFVNYPASDPETMAVGATNAPSDPTDAKSSNFANVGHAPGTTDFSELETSGTEVDLAAPGMEVEALLPDGPVALTGTSMAAPHVAGAAAVVIEADGGLGGSPGDLADRLRETARPVSNLATAEANAGLLDVAAAAVDDVPEDTQADVMNDEAVARNSAYRSEADARGGVLRHLPGRWA